MNSRMYLMSTPKNRYTWLLEACRPEVLNADKIRREAKDFKARYSVIAEVFYTYSKKVDTTIVLLTDGRVGVVKRHSDDGFNAELAILYALTKALTS